MSSAELNPDRRSGNTKRGTQSRRQPHRIVWAKQTEQAQKRRRQQYVALDPSPRSNGGRQDRPTTIVNSAIYDPQGVYWLSRPPTATTPEVVGLLDSMCTLLSSKYGEDAAELIGMVQFIRDSGSRDDWLLLWITALSLLPEMVQFVLQVDRNYDRLPDAKTTVYTAPNGRALLPDSAVSLSNFMHSFTNDFWNWQMSGMADTSRLRERVYAYYEHSGF